MNIHLPAILMFTRGNYKVLTHCQIRILSGCSPYRNLPSYLPWSSSGLQHHGPTDRHIEYVIYMGMGQNPIPLVSIKIAGKWMFIPLKMVCIGIDP